MCFGENNLSISFRITEPFHKVSIHIKTFNIDSFFKSFFTKASNYK